MTSRKAPKAECFCGAVAVQVAETLEGRLVGRCERHAVGLGKVHPFRDHVQDAIDRANRRQRVSNIVAMNRAGQHGRKAW